MNAAIQNAQDPSPVDLDAERSAQTREFMVTNGDYCVTAFQEIDPRSSFTWTFNLWAGLLGPV
jgi:hypothetical protein